MRLLPPNGHITGGSVTLLGRDLAGLDENEMRSRPGGRGRPHPPGPADRRSTRRCPSGARSARGCSSTATSAAAEAREPGPRGAAPGRDAPARGAARPVPPRALRRPPPAGDDRHGPGLRAEAAHRRRADHCPRRHHPGPDPRPHRRAPPAAAHGGHPDHPRHGGDRRTHRPGGRDVRRQGGRGGRDGRAVRPHPPPLQPGPAGLGPQVGPAARRAPAVDPRPATRPLHRPSSAAASPPAASSPPTSAGSRSPPSRVGRIRPVSPTASPASTRSTPTPVRRPWRSTPRRPSRRGRRPGAADGGPPSSRSPTW